MEPVTKRLTFSALRSDVSSAYRDIKSWNAVGKRFGITGGMAYRIAVNGHEPRHNHIRTVLGLPALVATPVCSRHGVVHCYDCEIQEVRPVRKPRRETVTQSFRVGKITAEERAAILTLTPGERKAALLKAAKGK